jgi:regulator of replication initiation timing
MDELKKFKAEFKRLRAENDGLRERLGRRERVSTKENAGSGLNGSKGGSNKSSLQVDSVAKGDRLSEYESFIRLMQGNRN